MTSFQKILADIYNEIKQSNRDLKPTSIPHSDDLLKQLQSMLGITADLGRNALRILNEAHMILVMEIVSEDAKRKIERIEGYIVADRANVYNLKLYFQDLLVKIYSKQFNKQLMANQIIKELFPEIKRYNSTELGQIVNKSIMLIEYERLLEKNQNEYTDEWKETKLAEIAAREKFEFINKNGEIVNIEPGIEIEEKLPEPAAISPAQITEGGFSRAVDSNAYKEFSEKKTKYPLQRILNIYGTDFFFRVNLRRCQFSYIKQVIEDKQITRREDLLHLKSLIEITKAHMSSKNELEKYKDDLYALERIVSRALYFTAMPKK